jgi:alanine dehydrogenase
MRIFVPQELQAEESRIPVVPATVKKLSALGAQATGHGFETVILVDHNNDQLAIWTTHAGPNLLTDGH